MNILPTDALVVVDVQNDFVNGSMAVLGAAEVIPPINALANAFDHVLVVTDWHPDAHISLAKNHPGAKHLDAISTDYGPQHVFVDHCVQGTAGAELAPGLELTKAEIIFRKGHRTTSDSYGAFFENDGAPTGFGAYIKARGLQRLFFAGLARYGCVLQSALGAAREGLEAAIVRDASAGDFNVEENDRLLEKAGVRWVYVEELLENSA